MSLRVRINLIITTLIVLFTLLTGNIIVDDMRRSIREEMEAGTKITLQHLNTVLYGGNLERSDGAAARAAAVPPASGSRARTRDPHVRRPGRLVYTSRLPCTRPAARAAMVYGWYGRNRASSPGDGARAWWSRPTPRARSWTPGTTCCG
jgi:hypothetical protein